MPWGVVKPSNPRTQSTSNPCLVVKNPQRSDEYMCPTSSYRELQQKLKKAFQKKFEAVNKDKKTCLHPCDFPYCVENCRFDQDQEHQSHRCEKHQVVPKAYSQQLRLPESSSPSEVTKETFVSADKDTAQSKKI